MPAAELAAPPAYEPVGQSKCGVLKSQRQPLIIEWPAADRAALEALAKRDLVAVRYLGCEMELLAQCRVPGSYRYTPITLKHDRITIRNADELYATVPLGAPKLEAKLQKAGQLEVAMTIVGRYDANRASVPADALEGICQRATHVVTGLTVGSFTFFAGAEAEVGGGVEVMGASAGARESASRELLNRDGDPSACEAARADDEVPPEGCGALLRLEVVPIGEDPSAPAVAKPASTGEAQPVVPIGMAEAQAVGMVVPPGPGVVKVHIDSPDSGTELRGYGVNKLEPLPDGRLRSVGVSTILCRAPCDEYVDARVGQPLYVVSPDMPSSSLFQLFDQEGEVELTVDPGNAALLTTGTIAEILGTLGAIGGLVTLITGGVIGIDAKGTDKTDANEVLLIGGVMFGSSAAVLGAGIAMDLSGQTDIEIVPVVPEPSR